MDTTPPGILGVAVSSGNYGHTSNLDVRVTFSELVNVRGTPRIALTIGSNLRQASYVSRSENGRELTFRYVVTGADSDSDGIELGTSLELNGGGLHDIVGNAVSALGP